MCSARLSNRMMKQVSRVPPPLPGSRGICEPFPGKTYKPSGYFRVVAAKKKLIRRRGWSVYNDLGLQMVFHQAHFMCVCVHRKHCRFENGLIACVWVVCLYQHTSYISNEFHKLSSIVSNCLLKIFSIAAHIKHSEDGYTFSKVHSCRYAWPFKSDVED